MERSRDKEEGDVVGERGRKRIRLRKRFIRYLGN